MSILQELITTQILLTGKKRLKLMMPKSLVTHNLNVYCTAKMQFITQTRIVFQLQTTLRVLKVLPMVQMVYQCHSRFYQWYHW